MKQTKTPKTPPIPTTLDEAVDQILAHMTKTDKIAFAAEPEDHPGSCLHFSTGMALRNEWGLWHGKTPISKWLRAHRIVHGDDQSAVIFKALWCRLQTPPRILDIAAEAEHYAAFWARSGLTWDMKPIPGHVAAKSWSIFVKKIKT